MDGWFYQLLRKRNYELIHVTGMRIGRVRNCYDIRFVDRLFASMEFEEVANEGLGRRQEFRWQIKQIFIRSFHFVSFLFFRN